MEMMTFTLHIFILYAHDIIFVSSARSRCQTETTIQILYSLYSHIHLRQIYIARSSKRHTITTYSDIPADNWHERNHNSDSPTRSPSTIHPRREKGSKCSGPIERRKFWRQRAMAARVRLKLARIQPHVTGASIHFILQAARPLLDLPPRFTLGAAASLTRPRASWIEWRGHAERHGDEGEGGTGRLRQRWSLRQYTRLPHSAIGEARVLGVRYQLSALLSVVKRRC